MARKTFIGDIHSAADDLRVLLSDPVIRDSQIIFLGDYIDGQDQRRFSDHVETNALDPLGVLDILMTRVNECGDVALLGNHDELWVETAKGDRDNYQMWQRKSNGQLQSKLGIQETSLAAVSAALCRKPLRKYTEFLDQMPLEWEDHNILAVHAGLNWQHSLRKQRDDDLLNIRRNYLFRNAHDQKKWHRNELGKVIVTGHTPVQHLEGTGKPGYLKMQASAHDVPRYLINSGSRSLAYDSGITALTLDKSGAIVQSKRVVKGRLYPGEQVMTEDLVSN